MASSAPADSASLFGLGNYLQDLESKFGLAIMEALLRLSTLTDANVFLLVDSAEGKRFCGKEYLCRNFVDGRLAYDAGKDTEMRLTNEKTGVAPVDVERNNKREKTPHSQKDAGSEDVSNPRTTPAEAPESRLLPNRDDGASSLASERQINGNSSRSPTLTTSPTSGGPGAIVVKRRTSTALDDTRAAKMARLDSQTDAALTSSSSSSNGAIKVETWNDAVFDPDHTTTSSSSTASGRVTSTPSASAPRATSLSTSHNADSPAVAIKDEIVLDDDDDDDDNVADDHFQEASFDLTGFNDDDDDVDDAIPQNYRLDHVVPFPGDSGDVVRSPFDVNHHQHHHHHHHRVARRPTDNFETSSTLVNPLASSSYDAGDAVASGEYGRLQLYSNSSFSTPHNHVVVVANSGLNSSTQVHPNELPDVRANLRSFLDADMKAAAVNSYPPEVLLIKESAGYKILSSLLYDVGKKYGVMSLDADADSLRYFYVVFQEFCSYFPTFVNLFNAKIVVNHGGHGDPSAPTCVSDARSFKTFMRAKMQRTFGRYSKRHC